MLKNLKIFMSTFLKSAREDSFFDFLIDLGFKRSILMIGKFGFLANYAFIDSLYLVKFSFACLSIIYYSCFFFYYCFLHSIVRYQNNFMFWGTTLGKVSKVCLGCLPVGASIFGIASGIDGALASVGKTPIAMPAIGEFIADKFDIPDAKPKPN
jgi:hypothetical protein